MAKRNKQRSLTQRLYRVNILPHGNGKGPDYIGPVLQNIENPPLDDKENETDHS